MPTVWDMNEANKDKYDTRLNTYRMFPVGTRVKAICVGQDHHFFSPERENLAGTVVRNDYRYLSIIVKWDEPRHYEGGHIQKEFNFEPDDLIRLTDEYVPTELEYAMKSANQMGICPEGDADGKKEECKGAFHKVSERC